MTAPGAPGAAAARWRLAGIALLGIGVAAAIYVAGRLHQPVYAFSLFGTDPVPPKSLLATIVLGLAVIQVLLALWMCRKLPLAGRPPRPVPVTHRVTGFALFALTGFAGRQSAGPGVDVQAVRRGARLDRHGDVGAQPRLFGRQRPAAHRRRPVGQFV